MRTRLLATAALSATVACSLLVSTGDLEGGGETGDAAVDASGDAAEAGATSPLGCNAPGLAAYWPFDEGQGATARDCTGHGHDAVLRDAGWTAGEDGGYALTLVPPGFAEVQNGATLAFPGAFSISTWVLVRTADSNGRILASSNPDPGAPYDPGFELTFESGPGSDGRQNFLSFIVWTPNADGGATFNHVDTRTIALGTWVHVAAVYDGTAETIFLDGALEQTATVGLRRISGQPFYIGRRTTPACCLLDGAVDELRYWQRALDADDVRVLAGK